MLDINPMVIAFRQAANGEAFAFAVYSVYAAKLRDAGMIQAAMLVEEMASNEKEHMEQWLNQLNMIPDDASALDALNTIISMEDKDANVMYTKLLHTVESSPSLVKNINRVTAMIRHLHDIEAHHRDMCIAMLQQYRTGISSGEKKMMWICPHCGNMYESKDQIPDECPVCKHDRSEYVYRETIVRIKGAVE